MHRELLDLQAQLLEAIFEPEALRPALDSFAQFCDAPISQLMIADGHRTLLQSTFSVPIEENAPATEADYQQINPRVQAIPRMKEGKATRDKDFITWDEIWKDKTYQELILPLGLGHISAVPIINTKELTAGIALHRPIADEPFSDETAARQELAARACAGVFHLAQRVHEHDVTNALNLFGPNAAVAILNAHGRLMDNNEPFERLCRRNTLRISKRQPFAEQQFSTEVLKRAIAMKSGTFLLRDRNVSASRIFCTVLPLPSVGSFEFSKGCAIIILRDEIRSDVLDIVALQKDFSLTSAEAEVAALITSGYSTEEISRKRRVSIHTTRSLLKRVQNKTHSTSQLEIATLVSNYRQP